MTEAIRIWQCVGCGAIEAPAECIGVCQYRPLEVLDLPSHHQVLERQQSQARAERQLIWLLAHSTAKPGREAELLAALQARAHALL